MKLFLKNSLFRNTLTNRNKLTCEFESKRYYLFNLVNRKFVRKFPSENVNFDSFERVDTERKRKIKNKYEENSTNEFIMAMKSNAGDEYLTRSKSTTYETIQDTHIPVPKDGKEFKINKQSDSKIIYSNNLAYDQVNLKFTSGTESETKGFKMNENKLREDENKTTQTKTKSLINNSNKETIKTNPNGTSNDIITPNKTDAQRSKSNLTIIRGKDNTTETYGIKLQPLNNNEEKTEYTKLRSPNSINTPEVDPDEDLKITYEFRDRKKDYLYGIHSVEAAISFNLRKSLDLFVQMSYKQNTPTHISSIIDLAKAKNIKIKYLTAEKMDKFTGNRPHNGLVLKSESRDYLLVNSFNAFKTILKKPQGNLFILLDQIVDPQNLGSIIRTAFYLGTDGILLNKNNKPPIGSTVCKVSSGASECIDLYALKSVKSFLAQAISGGWTVATTSIEKESDVQMRTSTPRYNNRDGEDTILRSFSPIVSKKISLEQFNVDSKSNVIVVLGSEANGIISDLSGVSHYNIYIPPKLDKDFIGKHPFDIIDSLNVGVSAGIIINHVKSKLKFNNL